MKYKVFYFLKRNFYFFIKEKVLFEIGKYIVVLYMF